MASCHLALVLCACLISCTLRLRGYVELDRNCEEPCVRYVCACEEKPRMATSQNFISTMNVATG